MYMRDLFGETMKILFKPLEIRFDKQDPEMARAVEPLVKALTPLILGALAMGIVVILIWKGHHIQAGIAALMSTIFRVIWQRLS
jgi:hypothetical protein